MASSASILVHKRSNRSLGSRVQIQMHTSLLNDLQEAIVGNKPPVLIFLVIPLAIVIDFYHFRRVITLLLSSIFHLITKESR
ncbi:unnamed protein product, partial [Prunus brigantina]